MASYYGHKEIDRTKCDVCGGVMHVVPSGLLCWNRCKGIIPMVHAERLYVGLPVIKGDSGAKIGEQIRRGLKVLRKLEARDEPAPGRRCELLPVVAVVARSPRRPRQAPKLLAVSAEPCGGLAWAKSAAACCV